MPKFPEFADRLGQLSGSVFEKFLPKMREKGDALVKLHIGDSYLPPPYELPIHSQFLSEHPFFNRYCNTMGVQELREVLAEKVSQDNQIPVDRDDVMMTCGASNALNVSMLSLVNPGEEVLVLTPCWPFFPGMVKVAGGKVVEAPVYMELYDNPELDLSTYLEKFITNKTVLLYLNTPNNPSGKVLREDHLAAVCDVVKRNNLWLVSDEAYDGMTFGKNKHISIARMPGMFERTLSIFTFSKVYMFAGLRLGYIATPHPTLKQLNKMLLHQLYSPSTLAQQMMVEPVKSRESWHRDFVEHCHSLRDIFTRELQAPYHHPEGAYYLFFSVKDLLRGRNYWALIEECLEIGVSIAPGNDFGKGFEDYIRICFAGEPPERLETAVKRLNDVLLGM